MADQSGTPNAGVKTAGTPHGGEKTAGTPHGGEKTETTQPTGKQYPSETDPTNPHSIVGIVESSSG